MVELLKVMVHLGFTIVRIGFGVMAIILKVVMGSKS
jgi:translation elongation factor EF-1beta